MALGGGPLSRAVSPHPPGTPSHTHTTLVLSMSQRLSTLYDKFRTIFFLLAVLFSFTLLYLLHHRILSFKKIG